MRTMKYRSRIDIMATILEATRVGASKTKIMYQAYLSYEQVQNYLRFLQEKDLLYYEKGTQLYRTTESGLKFLNASHRLDELTTGQT